MKIVQDYVHLAAIIAAFAVEHDNIRKYICGKHTACGQDNDEKAQ